MNNDIGFSKSVLLAFLAGGLTGAATALLLAPRSGEMTRGLITEEIREGLRRGRDARARIRARGREVIDGASDFLETQKKGLEDRKDRVVAAVDAGRKAYRDGKPVSS
jgi:gas vesicle protein